MKLPENLNLRVTANTIDFRWCEFACKCNGEFCSGFPEDLSNITKLSESLQKLRNLLNYVFIILPGRDGSIAIHINLGYCCAQYNALSKICGLSPYQHLTLNAANIVAYYTESGLDINGHPLEVLDHRIVAQLSYGLSIFHGVERYATYTHVDHRDVKFRDGFQPVI